MNAAVGERMVKLGGREYLCRPGFKAFAQIEELTNSSIVEIIRRFSEKRTRITDIAAIIYACASQGAKDFTLSMDDVGEIVFVQGMNEFLLDALGLISTIYKGIEKKDQPTPEKT